MFILQNLFGKENKVKKISLGVSLFLIILMLFALSISAKSPLTSYSSFVVFFVVLLRHRLDNPLAYFHNLEGFFGVKGQITSCEEAKYAFYKSCKEIALDLELAGLFFTPIASLAGATSSTSLPRAMRPAK